MTGADTTAGGPLAGEDWRLLREEARPGATQMALDEIAARTAGDGGVRTVRVYRWEPGCLSMGYGQDPDTVDWDFCGREGIDVTRRQTGGGGIYHDPFGDISYSIVAPAAELPGDLMECYELLLEPVLEAFARLGIDAGLAEREYPAIHEPACYLRAVHPAHDVLAYGGREDARGGERAGRKISGNAQYRQRDAVIQHGSISFADAAERHLGVFADPGTTPERFHQRVAAIDDLIEVDREAAVTVLEDALADWADATAGGWTDDELASARDLAAEKYASDGWVRRPPEGP